MSQRTLAQQTVTTIRIKDNEEGLFDSMTSDDLTTLDVDATVEAYQDAVIEQLAKWYPQADIRIINSTVSRVEVSIDTTLDNSRDEEDDFRRSAVEEDVAKDVDDARTLVWERGNFGVEKDA